VTCDVNREDRKTCRSSHVTFFPYNVAMKQETQSYKDLVVWQKGISLAKAIYQLTAPFPAEEKFGLVSQMRRAAISIPSNIAEGQARHTTGEFIQFISHAEGSTAELETQLILSIELGFADANRAKSTFVLLDDIRRMLNGLRRKLQEK
jgi:four helix bundle protein